MHVGFNLEKTVRVIFSLPSILNIYWTCLKQQLSTVYLKPYKNILKQNTNIFFFSLKLNQSERHDNMFTDETVNEQLNFSVRSSINDPEG